jgi:hypothetical protein
MDDRHGIKKQLKRLKAENSRPKYGISTKMKFSFLELRSGVVVVKLFSSFVTKSARAFVPV